MKKIVLALFVVALNLSAMSQDVKLPQPLKKGGMPLYEALNNRQTNRDFNPNRELSLQQLSDMLWCASGVNREDGRMTAPTARNAQEIDLYVFLPKGVYLYMPKENLLKLVIPEDLRAKLSSRSKMPAEAPVSLLFVANYKKMDGFDQQGREFYGATDAAFVSQNVYLYCAANDLNTVVMGAIDRDAIHDFLKLDGKAVLAQPVGYPAK